MADTNPYDAAIAEELNRIGKDLECERYPHETNDEYGYRLMALVEDDIDRLAALITDLDKVRGSIAALL
jgi:ppGpp synthetase/RelA/SpoT-type nucleotidyltranferase